jgi:exosortase/archaeosortase family protein
MRSLMAYVALGVAWAYLEHRPLWHRTILVAATVPIAVFINIVRVTITCTMYVADRPELGQDFMHGLVGMAMLVPALLLLWALNWLLNNLFIEEEEPPPSGEVTAK